MGVVVRNVYHWVMQLLYLLAFYFLLLLFNLTRLPIFNDEAIYLDWAWSFTHYPGHLFDSLLDAKQPLMIWIFAVFENIFTDPLLAGRFVSVLVGCVTLLGIYSVTNRLLGSKGAILASLLYTIIPIFVFYNRQALMEAGVACVGIWSFYYLLNLIQDYKFRDAAMLGVILGVGFLIKTSAILFLLSALVMLFAIAWKRMNQQIGMISVIVLGAFMSIVVILIVNLLFWQSLASNSRYALSLSEMLAFPADVWLHNLAGFFEIGLVFVTPIVFILCLIGLWLMNKNKVKEAKIFLGYFLLPLVLEIILVRNQSQRYLVPFLTFMVVPVVYVTMIWWRRNLVSKMFVLIVFLLPLYSTFRLVVKPDRFIEQSAILSQYAEIAHIHGQTSGYGIQETIQYIKSNSVVGKPTMVLFALNTGNPENAVNLYSANDYDLYGLHLDSKMIENLGDYSCLSSDYPTFFVSRNNELAGMEDYFELVQSFPNPRGGYFIGVSVLKRDCTGEVGSLSDMYQGSMRQIKKQRSF